MTDAGSTREPVTDREEVGKMPSNLAFPEECISGVCVTLAPNFPSSHLQLDLTW